MENIQPREALINIQQILLAASSLQKSSLNCIDDIQKVINSLAQPTLKTKPAEKVNDFVRLYTKDDGVYAGDTKVISRASKQQHAIFSILVDHYTQEIMNGACYLPTAQLLIKLQEDYDITLDETEMRRLIYQIRSKFKKLAGVEVIDSEKWKGYRLSNNVFLDRFELAKCAKSGGGG